MATFGLGMTLRSSPSQGCSTPPLKKKVTWAYFSVSAMRSWVLPWAARYSPSVFFSSTGGYATSQLGIVASYSAMQT